MWAQEGDSATILDAIPQPNWMIRPDGGVDTVNAALRDYAGLAVGQPVMTDVACPVGVHAEDVPLVAAAWRETVARNAVTEVECRLRRADGVYRLHRVQIAPIEASGWRIAVATDIDDHLQIVAALEANEARYRDVVEHADDIVYTITLDGDILAVNNAVERVLGYRPDELLGRSINRLIAPEQLEMSRAMLERKLRGEERSTYELDALATDGRRVTLEVNTRLTMTDAQVPIIHGIARDISTRRERMRHIELSAAIGSALTSPAPLVDQLGRCAQAMVDHLGAAFARIWTLDDTTPELLVLRASAGFYTHLDGPHSRIRVGEYKIGRIAAQRRPHLTNGVVGDPEVHDQAWARREGMVSFAGYPLVAGDQLLGVVAVFARHPLAQGTLSLLRSVVNAIAVGIDRDRAERAQQQALRRERDARQWVEAAERRFRALFEGVADAIFVADVNRMVLDVNPAATRMLGFGRDELLGMRLDAVVAMSPAWMDGMVMRLLTDGHWSGDLDLRRSDGSTVPGEARSTIVDLPDGPVYLSTIRDVTERNHFARLQRDFMAMATHDLRTPLTSIKGWAQLLQRRLSTDHRTGKATAAILSQVEQMERLTRDLADLVQVDSDRLQMTTSAVDLVAVVRQQVDTMRAQAREHRFRLDVQDMRVVGMWDRHRIGQICHHLLSNAVKYSPAGAEILVRIEVREQEGWLIVADRGPGIEPDLLPLLFKRLYRADVTGAGGLGLGLYLSHMLARAHGGRIWATSQPGEGSTFTLALPLDTGVA